MSQDLSGTSFEEFITKQATPQPPTPAEVELARNKKTSRANPPKDLPGGG